MPGKIFINETADKQKVELTTGADGVTGGYYDAAGEWHEFGSGSSGILNKPLHVTLVNNSGDVAFPNFEKFVIDDFAVQTQLFPEGLADGSTSVFDVFFTKDVYESDPVPYDGDGIVYIGNSNRLTVTDTVNCQTYEDAGDLNVIVLDITKPSSCTVTFIPSN